MSSRIVSVTPTNELFRKPKSISLLGEYKANEFRALMLYYLRFALTGLLDSKYIKHFHLLCSAMYMLLSENISNDAIKEAEIRLQTFADDFEELYGENNVTIKLHLIRHLASCVRDLGPLWSQSAYGFENNNGLVVRGNTSKNNIAHQITWKYLAKLTHNKRNEENNKFSIGKQQIIKLSTHDIDLYTTENFQLENRQHLKIITYIILNGVKFTSKMSRTVSTVDYFVQLKNGTIGSVCYYVALDSILYACIDIHDISAKFDHFTQILLSNKKKYAK